MILLIELIILLMTPILVFHAIRSYSIEFAKIFWMSGLFLGALREFALVYVSGLYSYGEFNITIAGFPLVYLLLWSNLSYVSWQWSNNYLGLDYLKAQTWDHHLALIFGTMILIAFFMESFFSQYQMIQWQLSTSLKLWGGVPVLGPFAYGFTSVFFMMSVKWALRGNSGQTKVSLTLLKMMLSQPLVVLALAGLLFCLNILIILIFQ